MEHIHELTYSGPNRSDAPISDPFFESLADAGEMGPRMLEMDWARTALGGMAQWPHSLKTAAALVLNSPVPIVMLWGLDGIMIYNDAYSVFAGGRHPHLLGSPVLAGWPEVADFNRRVMAVGLSGGKLSFRDEHLVLHRNGVPEDVWLNLDYSPIRDETGTPAGVLAIVVETTQRVVAERQVRELNEKLEAQVHALAELDRAKTSFFTNVSHEFRTPLTLILGPTEDALVSPARALSGEDLQTVYRNELRLLKLVNALLDVSRIEAGRLRASYEPLDLGRVTLDTGGDFRSAIERAGLEYVVTIDPVSMFEEMVGTSPALQPMLARVAKVAGTDSTVLITGETGTGKELVARAVHRRSARASRAFVSVNCAAVPRELIASELFGHEKGAFTGATQRRLGRFELAHGGTLFLDEVGELPMETQLALLRVLQEREFERVGGSIPIRVDVRVVAATNRDLQAAIEAGTFRRDLFYRLNVFPLAVPPLRERGDDISLLVEYFIDRYARKAGKTIRRVNKRMLDRLRAYPWPGNVRELQNVVERSVIVCDTDEFTVDESWLSTAPAKDSRALSSTLAGHEKAIIEDALRASGGLVYGPSGAAARLGIARSTLESKIQSLGIDKNRFRAPRPKR